MSLQDFRLRSSGAFFLGHPRVEDCAPDPALRFYRKSNFQHRA